MKRRAWLLAGVAAAAGAGGAGLAWWGRQQDSNSSAVAPAAWEHPLETLDGQALTLAQMRGRPLVINFWATWCPPCVKELPEIEHFYQSHREKDWQVLALAVDQAQAVHGFLQKTRLSFPVALAGPAGLALSRSFGNTTGALPFTVLLDRQGRVRQRKLGPTSFDELSDWARQME